MARKTIVQFLSDLSGQEGAENVTFSVDGGDYEIDLTEKESAAFHKALKKYVDAGRRVGGRRRGVLSGKPTARTGPTSAEVREWARSQGMEVTDRGRIPNEIQEKYQAAH